MINTPLPTDNELESMQKITAILYIMATNPPPSLAPTTSDNEMTSLQKQNALLLLIQQAAGSGGGGGGVQNPSTAQLVMQNDTFDENVKGVGAAIPAVMIENAAATDRIGICIGQFGDSINFIKANGAQAHVRMKGGVVVLTYSNNSLLSVGADPYIFDWNDAGGFHLRVACDETTGDLQLTGKPGFGVELVDPLSSTPATTRLHLATDGSGDLIAICTTGTNAGKSINLTTGFVSTAAPPIATLTAAFTVPADGTPAMITVDHPGNFIPAKPSAGLTICIPRAGNTPFYALVINSNVGNNQIQVSNCTDYTGTQIAKGTYHDCLAGQVLPVGSLVYPIAPLMSFAPAP